jgi:hypothetical protein
VPEVRIKTDAALFVAHFVTGRMPYDLANAGNRLKPGPIAPKNATDSLGSAPILPG